MPLRFAAALLAAALPWPAFAAGPQPYALDPVHTRVLFAVDHAGFSRALGTVSGSAGTLWFDPQDWRSARLEVSVPLQRLDLGDEHWNRAALAPALLDAKRHPQARFVSRQVEPVDAGRARVCGELTLRGATGPLCLDVTLNALKRHPLPPFRRTAGFSATATLSRAAFGIDAWKNVIGDRVELRIEAEAVRMRADDAAAGAAAPTPEPRPAAPAAEPPAEPEPEPTR
ncbi:YceI family protein [Vulcaniibacterium tengchongense]|uniref:Polyisoprenoid-binding protein YceI n=1 Tax=Vulcaniibacterium tengchongense TaxID=1273429 RepID=A0A3N4W704_9GAMM|nr:YceI family protein [Vulcaniibacterium tengchongense]RPE80984.1 polyisoprenoid-binding protein YceI [Vulcaniibacterium tengchongense]